MAPTTPTTLHLVKIVFVITALTFQLHLREVYAGMSLMNVRMTAKNPGGNPISEVMMGDQFIVDVFMQDIRDPSDPAFMELGGDPANLGVFAAYFDFAHSLQIEVGGDFEHGSEYLTLNTGAGVEPFPTVSPGLIEDLGGGQTDIFAGPTGPTEFLLVSIPLQGSNAAVAAVDDMIALTPGINRISVLDNDILGG